MTSLIGQMDVSLAGLDPGDAARKVGLVQTAGREQLLDGDGSAPSGVIVVKLAEIALVTLPMGRTVFVIASAGGKNSGATTIVTRVARFPVPDIVVLDRLPAFPALSRIDRNSVSQALRV
jgi:hypothetical protein